MKRRASRQAHGDGGMLSRMASSSRQGCSVPGLPVQFATGTPAGVQPPEGSTDAGETPASCLWTAPQDAGTGGIGIE